MELSGERSLKVYLTILVALVAAMFYLAACGPLGHPPESKSDVIQPDSERL